MKVDPAYISCRVKKELGEQIQPLLNNAMKRLNSEEHRFSNVIESIVESAAAEVGNLKDIAIHDARKEVEKCFDSAEDGVLTSWDTAIDAEIAKVVAQNNQSEWGLEFSNQVFIAQIPPGSLFSSPGLVAITSRTTPTSASEAACAMDELSSLDHCKVYIKAQGIVGTVVKTKLESLTGMIIDDDKNHGVTITEIMKGSLFASTKSKVGMRILSVNSSPLPFTAEDAAQTIRDAVGVVKVVAAYPTMKKANAETEENYTVWEKILKNEQWNWKTLFSTSGGSGSLSVNT
jgi:hypothetical protein